MRLPPLTRLLHVLAVTAVLAAAGCSSSHPATIGATTTVGGGTGSTSPAGGGTSPSTTEAATTTTEPATTTTVEPIVTTGGIVKVANASHKNGVALLLTSQLKTRGFTTRDPTNAFGPDSELAVSKVYVIAGHEAVARSVARLLGGVAVLPMPVPAWITDGTVGLGDANVLVMLGADRAGQPLGTAGG